ncbi:MAG: hypothetical protein DCC75_07295 [Proteobacteria bacterium]|nr:MAG: hypothetical protein DCC75_07295 [Pseudomonadota bacterium]
MHYFREGSQSAPAVLLLHGNPTWSFYYRDLIAGLRQDFQVIAVDYIGCGLSDHPANGNYRAVDRIRQLQEFIEKLGLEKFSLVMHDWGGPIGAGLAVRMPQKISSMIFLNTTLTQVESLPGFIKLAASPLMGRTLTQQTNAFLKLATNLGVYNKLPREVRQSYYFPYRSSADRIAIWNFVKDIPFDSTHPSYSEMLELGRKLPELKHIPVKIIWGLQDPCFHREMLSEVASHFPHGEVVEIREASHLVLEDAPKRVLEEIDSFLKGNRRREAAVEPEHEIAPGSGPVLYETFLKIAQEQPQLPAVICSDLPSARGQPHPPFNYRQVNFGELLSLVYKYERGLRELGLRNGQRILMLVPPGMDFLALSYAVMGRGAVPVFVDPGVGFKNLERCIADAAPDGLIGAPKAQLLRLARRSLFRNIKFSLNVTDSLFSIGPNLSFLKRFSSLPLERVEVKHDSAGLVAFTSGATGTPKGVIFTHEMLREQLKIFGRQLGMACGSKDLPLLPIFSLFSLPLGVCSVIAPLDPARPLDLDPAKIARIIQDTGVESSFGSPTLWNKISEYCIRHRRSFPALKKVFMAGAPVPESVLLKIKNILPNGEAFTPYGATEALPVSLISAAEIASSELKPVEGVGVGTPVGKVLGGIELRIIEASDSSFDDISEVKALGPYQVGEIIVRGRNISPNYLNRPDATRRSKIRDGQNFWHRMGDLGYLDAGGSLYFCGRQAHAVKLSECTLYSDPVERVFNLCEKLRRSALVALNQGVEAALVVEPLPEFWPASKEEEIKFIRELREIAQKHPFTSKIKKFFFHSSFPVDARHNAKIFREQLGEWASKVDSVTGSAAA